MARILIPIAWLLCFSSCAQPRKDTAVIRLQEIFHEFNLGETHIRVIETFNNPADRFVFIKLHDNEQTSADAALKVIEQQGGRLISIENNGERNIDFFLDKTRYRFDPNRIFTKEGRRATLEVFKNTGQQAENELEKFASFLLKEIPTSSAVIALHNNTDSEYSILDYHRELGEDAQSIYINPEMDPDDFVFTTDAVVFRQLKKAGINAVLQANRSVTDDGSLSVLCGQTGRTYINIEAEHGHLTEQQEMISVVVRILQGN